MAIQTLYQIRLLLSRHIRHVEALVRTGSSPYHVSLYLAKVTSRLELYFQDLTEASSHVELPRVCLSDQ